MINMPSLKKNIVYGLRNVGLDVSLHRPRGKEKIPHHFDQTFMRFYKKVCHKTMVPLSALYSTYEAAKYIAQNNVPGDIIECGVWKGGCTMLIAETLAHFGCMDKKIYMYDTFAGMAEPTEADFGYIHNYSAKDEYERRKQGDAVDWCNAPLEEVKSNIAGCSYPVENFILVQGKVEEKIPQTIPEKIALLRLDTDWYESTKHEMEHLYPLLVAGGIFICDDYGAWAGSRKAVDEYFEANKPAIYMQYDVASSVITGLKVK